MAVDLTNLPEVEVPLVARALFWPEFWEAALPVISNNQSSVMASLSVDEAKAIWARLYSRFVQVNSAINLTRITDAKAFFYRHVLDSWTVLPHIPQKAHVLDVGTGGGFPALPVAWARPDITMVANDSVAKKLTCVSDFAAVLALSNLATLHGRTEELAHMPMHRESYDGVLARGVAALPTLIELTLPLIKAGGTLWAFKTQAAAHQELAVAKNALQVLGGKVTEIIATETHADEPLVIVAIQKIKPSPKQYPRSKNLPRKSPLG